MKKTLSVFLIIATAVVFMFGCGTESRESGEPSAPDTALSKDEEPISESQSEEGKEYVISDTVTAELNGGTLTVRGTGRLQSYEFSSEDAAAVTDVIIEEGITFIERWALSSFENVKSVTLPEGLTGIADYAFRYTSRIESLHFPSTLTFIGDNAFMMSRSLTGVTVAEGNTVYKSVDNCLIDIEKKQLVLGCKNSIIPADESVTAIGFGAFAHCEDLESIDIPDTITEICDFAFCGCSSLRTLTVPDSVTALHSFSFSDCTNLKEVKLSSGLTELGSCAFSDCISLKSITVPSGIKTVGENAFEGCLSLETVVLPDGLKEIACSAFEGCASLVNITVPESVTTIGMDAFCNCAALRAVHIPASVADIGSGAFNNCYSLSEIKVDGNNDVYHSGGNCIIETASKKLIAGCKNSVIPADDSVTVICCDAFRGLTLENLHIPSQITEIEKYAFSKCNVIGTVSVDEGNPVYRSENNCLIETETRSLLLACNNGVIPNGILTVESGAVTQPTIKSVTIPSTVTKIEENAIELSELSAITAESGNAVYHSENNCLIETESKTLILGCRNSAIPTDGSVTAISNAFYVCTDMQEIIIPEKVTLIAGDAFNTCRDLTFITFEVSDNWVLLDADNNASPVDFSDPRISAETITSEFYTNSFKRLSDDERAVSTDTVEP